MKQTKLAQHNQATNGKRASKTNYCDETARFLTAVAVEQMQYQLLR
jgi:hypothetical protein